MNFSRAEISAAGLRSLSWDGDTLVDWLAGRRYSLQGSTEAFNVGSGYRFNSAIGFGALAVSFEGLGTKGLLLRDNGQRSIGNYAPLSVDMFDGHPRILRLSTGAIVERWDDLEGGEGVHFRVFP